MPPRKFNVAKLKQKYTQDFEIRALSNVSDFLYKYPELLESLLIDRQYKIIESKRGVQIKDLFAEPYPKAKVRFPENELIEDPMHTDIGQPETVNRQSQTQSIHEDIDISDELVLNRPNTRSPPLRSGSALRRLPNRDRVSKKKPVDQSRLTVYDMIETNDMVSSSILMAADEYSLKENIAMPLRNALECSIVIPKLLFPDLIH